MSDTYEEQLVAPLKACVGSRLTGAVLSGLEGEEPDELVLSFEDREDVLIGVWHGMGASGFSIEAKAKGSG